MLDDLRQALEKQALAGVLANPDFPIMSYTGVYRKRQRELGIPLYQLMGIARDDKEKRDQLFLRMLRAFEAPNAIIVSIDKEICSLQSALDLGAVTQTIALVALNFDLGTCIASALVFYPEITRSIAGIPDSKKLAIGITIGYPTDFPANKLQSTREPVDNVVTWRGL